MKSQKYWNYKMLLGVITTMITQLSFLFVLYYRSSYCRRLMKLLMKWAQFVNNDQRSTLEGPMTKQFVLHSIFYVLVSRTDVIADKRFNLFDECAARCADLFPQEEVCTSSSWGDSKMYTSGSIANSQAMLTEINESCGIAKKGFEWKMILSNIKGI